MPLYSKQKLLEMVQWPFGHIVAEVLNDLFDTAFTQWDVEFACGRSPVRFTSFGRRITFAECWHNPAGTMNRLVSELAALVCGSGAPESGGWLELGIRCAILAGALLGAEKSVLDHLESTVDVCMAADDFYSPVSALLLKRWGFPIDKIIVSCGEHSPVWDLQRNGQIGFGSRTFEETGLPKLNYAHPECLECLVALYSGSEECNRFVDFSRAGSVYWADQSFVNGFQQDFYVSVVGEQRCHVESDAARYTRLCPISAMTASAFIAWQDYTTAEGSLNYGLVISEDAPE